MPGRWSDEWRDRGGRREDWREDEPRRWSGSEDRSFDREDRVFGERETGVGYNQPREEFQREQRDMQREYRGRGDWQDRDYGGVSPAMRRGDYDTGYRANPRFQNQDYTRGGRYYGDEGRASMHRENYGKGGYEYGAVPRGYDQDQRSGSRGHGQHRESPRWQGEDYSQFGSPQADERWRREMNRGATSYHGQRTFSGGTGGYDYERGYGDGGRGEGGRDYDRDRFSYGRSRDHDRDGDRDFEDRARDAGDFFRRTGEKVKSWFNDMARDDDRDHTRDPRGARGLGPKDYKRSDERISDEVHQRLTDDSWLDASNINVSVSGGEVTLSGTVENREAKHRAERIVEDLSGVNHVQNNLRIQSGSFFTSAGRGFGDSVQEAQMRRDDPVKDSTDGATGGSLSGGAAEDNAATRTTTRRS